jgi:hypothetical protein
MMPEADSDIYDGAPWTEMDIEDLKAAIEHGRIDRGNRGVSAPLRHR